MKTKQLSVLKKKPLLHNFNIKFGLASMLAVRRSLLVFLALFISIASMLPALDFTLRPKGFVAVPMGKGNQAPDGNGRYTVGGGGELGFEIDFSSIWPNPLGLGYTLGIEGGMQFSPLDTKNESPVNVSFYSFDGVLGLYFFPLSRLFTRLEGAVGVFSSTREDGRSDPGLFWRAGGEIGFRFTPSFTLAANLGWRQYRSPQNEYNSKFPLINSNLYAGLTAQITFQTGGANREGVSTILDQYGEMFPVFMQMYQTNPIGSVILRNNENAEIRNVRLFFRASGYTASEFPCGELSIIPRGRKAEMPLLADFSPNIMRFTDKGRVMGELVIRYTFLGKEREVVRAVTVATNNRNMIIADDTAAFAAFISSSSPEVLDFARFISGLVRGNQRIGHNQNMQYAMWLLEGLKASGIILGETYAAEDEAQYPAETLAYRTGSARDLALLFAACLESVGVGSAFLQTGDDFLVAVSMGVGESAAETLFNSKDKRLVVNDEVWLPLSMSAFNDGFLAAWARGAEILTQTFNEGRNADFVIVEEAWSFYPPASLPELGSGSLRTDNAAATRAVNNAVQTYITQEINPLINAMSGNNTAAGQNRMGILYVRAGRISEGKAAYERAAGMGSVPAMTNRGNLALSEQDLATAERWFRQALQRDPENRTALRGLEQIQASR